MDIRLFLILTCTAIVQICLPTATPWSTSTAPMCGNLTCSYNARCKNDSWGNQYCQCHLGFEGITCHDDVDECTRGNPCYHRGVCHNTIGGWWCECLDGWNGTEHCNDNITEVRDCMPGWRGDWCQDQCYDDSHCGANSYCRLLHNGNYRCFCTSGWTGGNCTDDRDECSRRPQCRNAGTCINTPGSYLCICPEGWSGTYCDADVDECTTNTWCVHTDNCTNHVGSYTCQCSCGWHGDRCIDDVNECDTSPCNDTLVCQNTQGSYRCVQRNETDRGNASPVNVLVLVVTSMAVFLLLLVILISISICKGKRTPRNKVAEQ